jgi:predicted ATPase
MSTANGGQVLLSSQSEVLLRERLPEGVALRDMGAVQLKDFPHAEHVFQLVAPDLWVDFPALKSLATIPNNLPAQLTSFIGREKEVAEVRRLLATTRLLTLTGSGGTGKTRLSLRVAEEFCGDASSEPHYSDGVWFVELAPVTDPALVPQTVATVLGLRDETGQALTERLAGFLRDKQVLLILDNCEHLLEGCARLSDTLLRAAPNVKIIASSREALGIAGETTYHVPSLATPGGQPSEIKTQPSDLLQYAAVRLFVERAAAAKPGFTLNDSNAPVVAQVCARLDGIPLAIELAAARVRALPVEQIAARLDDRFRLLTGGSRTALPRQQTLRALIDWSHALLTEPERVLLRRLSVFAGGWTLEAAEVVTKDEGKRMKDETDSFHPSAFILHPSDVFDLLTRLVEKSLVNLDEQAAEPRYVMLETIRQYARDKLLESDEGESLRDAHLSYFTTWAERMVPRLQGGPDQ